MAKHAVAVASDVDDVVPVEQAVEQRGGLDLYPRCPTCGTSRLPTGRRFRAESIRSDSNIDASNHGHEGPPKSDSKR